MGMFEFFDLFLNDVDYFIGTLFAVGALLFITFFIIFITYEGERY